MKRIVAFVLPAPLREGDDAADAARSQQAADHALSALTAAVSDHEGVARLEAVVPDRHAERVAALLLEQTGDDHVESVIAELLEGEMRTAGPDAQDLFERVMLSVERQLISHVYAACDHVKTKAAARLGIDRNTLHKKLRQYHLIDAEHDAPAAPHA